MKIRGLVKSLLLCLVLVAMAVPAYAKQYTVAFVPGITTDAFYLSMKRGVDAKAKELGIKIIFDGAAEWNYEKQIPIIESMIAKKVDLIVTAPTHSKNMIAVLKKAVDAGIPVITVDTNIDDDSFIVANITSDNTAGGQMAADAIAKKIGSKGKVMVIGPNKGTSTTDQREQGFVSQLKQYPGMTLAIEPQYCNDQAERAAAIFQSVFAKNKDLKAVFADNVVSAEGIIAGLKARGLIGKIALVAYDAGDTQVAHLRQGDITALVVQKPMAEGEIAIEYAKMYLSGKNKDKIEKHKLIPAVIATKENMNQPEISKWFYTAN